MNFKKYLIDLKSGIITMFKEFFNPKTNKKQRANMWTFQRLILPIIALITSLNGLSILSAIIIGFGGITDFVDGKSARKYNSNSEFGKVLDQISDKFFAGVVGINLSILNPIFIPVVIMEGAIALVNIYYKKNYPKINNKSSMIGKIKQFPLFISMGIGFLSNLNIYFKAITNILVIITLLMQSTSLAFYSVTKYKQASKIESEKLAKKENNNNIVNDTTNFYTKQKSITFKICHAPKVNHNFQKIKQKNRKR